MITKISPEFYLFTEIDFFFFGMFDELQNANTIGCPLLEEIE